MNNPKNARLFSIITAVCFSIFVLLNTIDGMIGIYNTFGGKYSDVFIINSLSFCLPNFIVIGYVILLFIGKKSKLFVILAGIKVLLTPFHDSWLSLVLALTLFILILINFLPNFKQYRRFNKILAFIPCIIHVLSSVINILEVLSFYGSLHFDIMYYILSLIGIFAYLFFGLWLKVTENESIPTKTEKIIKTPKIITTKTSSGADDLIMLKNLFDSGAITQEEFDQKKTQILNN